MIVNKPLHESQTNYIKQFLVNQKCKYIPKTNYKKSAGHQWFEKFRGGDVSLDDDKWSGPPSDVDSNQSKPHLKPNHTELFESNWFWIAHKCIGRFSTIWEILENQKTLDKWMPHDKNDNQKKHHYEVSSSLLLHIWINYYFFEEF